MLRLSRQEGRCLRSEAEGEGGPLGQLQCAAVCECMRVCALSSDSSSAPTPHPSMTSHFLGCLCMGWGGGGGRREREKKLAPLFRSPHLGKRSRDGVGVGLRLGTCEVDRTWECRAAAGEGVLAAGGSQKWGLRASSWPQGMGAGSPL